MEIRVSNKSRKIHFCLLAAFLAAFIWSGINPYDRQSWILLSAPAVIIVSVLFLTYRKFEFSTMVYLVVLVHMLVLLIGARYTYSDNPFFNMLMNEFGLKRNYFDRVGHFAQGFGPALMTKEVLIKGGYIKRGKMMYLIIISMCLGFSAAYELIEFATAKLMGVPVETIMGIQGDYWDSIWDMFFALLGACTAIFGLGRLHDKFFEK